MIKYQHIERFGNSDVEGIDVGTCHIFPKIDGTLGAIHWEDGIHCYSKNRELSVENDNQGFMQYVLNNPALMELSESNPDKIFFGEWLVPHTLKDYRDDAWRQFYIFDVGAIDGEDFKYLPYDSYVKLFDDYDVEYIPPLLIAENVPYEKMVELLDKNMYLMKDGAGPGEGIIIKNYDFVNKYGRVKWAKIVRSEFKDKHRKNMGSPHVKYRETVEHEIIDKFCTDAFIEKTFAKIKNKYNGFESKHIGELLGTIFHDFVEEETYNAVKKFKMPTINFKTLNYILIKKVKEALPEIF